MENKIIKGILDKLQNVKAGTNGWTALCPAHDDTRSSLSVAEGEDGRVLVHCFAGCTVEEIADALNIGVAELFAGQPRRKGSSKTAASSPEHTEGLSLAAYAEAKRLPVDFLQTMSIREVYLQGVKAIGMPYLRIDGSEAALRFRLSIDGEPRFRWRTGSKPILYGLWNRDAAIQSGFVCLVEGESDVQTLWHNNFLALGLPGANSWREEWADLFDGIERIYLVIEPDRGGEAVISWLRKSKIRDRVRLVRLQGAKDASELYLQDPKNFKAAWTNALKQAQPWNEFERAEADAKTEHLRAQCEDLASNPDILGEFERALQARNVAGEKSKAKLIYLSLTSRLLGHIVSIGPKGASSAGKSFLTVRVLDFFPTSAYYLLTAMSDKALAYSDEPLSHRFLVLNEATALGGDWVSYFVRSLLSEGRLVYETVEKTPDGLKSRRIEREGPTGLIVTTTAVALHPENETRFISLQMDDSSEQTARILRAEAAGAASTDPRSAETVQALLAPWLALQEWLAATDNRVVIPYAPEIADLVPPAAVRLRRDFNSVLSLIMAHAILHKANRKRDKHGRIIAKFADYKTVRELAHGWIAEGAERTVSKKIRETVTAVEEICSDQDSPPASGLITATVTQVADGLKLDRSTAYRRIRQAIDRGFLQNTEKIEKGRPLKIALGDPMPENKALLPTVEQVIAHLKVKRGH